MKKFIAGVVAMSIAASSLTAFAGVGGGSGDNGTKSAYDEQALKQAGLDFSLDYLKLKPKDIADRDKKLAEIFGKLDKVNVASAINTIHKTYGSNVFEFTESCPKNIDDPVSRMSAAVYKYFSDTCQFEKADPNEVPFGNALKAQGKVPVQRMSGSEKRFNTESDSGSGFLVASYGATDDGWFLTHHGSYTSTTVPLADMPIFVRFLQAMKESNLRALDATLVFVKDPVSYFYNENKGTSYYGWGVLSNTYALYPPYSDLAPIPKPVLVISSMASKEEILDFINENAPRVYAFNKLFDQKVVLLPTQNELMKALIDAPDILAEAQKVKKEATREEVAQALHIAFLGITYAALAAGAIAAPIALIDVVNNAFMRPILIRGVITVIGK
jgi:hypothetical protein